MLPPQTLLVSASAETQARAISEELGAEHRTDVSPRASYEDKGSKSSLYSLQVLRSACELVGRVAVTDLHNPALLLRKGPDDLMWRAMHEREFQERRRHKQPPSFPSELDEHDSSTSCSFLRPRLQGRSRINSGCDARNIKLGIVDGTDLMQILNPVHGHACQEGQKLLENPKQVERSDATPLNLAKVWVVERLSQVEPALCAHQHEGVEGGSPPVD